MCGKQKLDSCRRFLILTDAAPKTVNEYSQIGCSIRVKDNAKSQQRFLAAHYTVCFLFSCSHCSLIIWHTSCLELFFTCSRFLPVLFICLIALVINSYISVFNHTSCYTIFSRCRNKISASVPANQCYTNHFFQKKTTKKTIKSIVYIMLSIQAQPL